MEMTPQSNDSQVVSNFKTTSLKWGLIGGLLIILFSIIMYAIDSALLVNTWAGLIGFVVLLTVIILSVKEVKLGQDGFISLSEALFAGFLVYVIASFLHTVFQYALFNWIDTNLPILLKEKTIATTVEMMQKFGASEEDINKTLSQLDGKLDVGNPANMFWNFLKGSAFGFVICFIIALIMKKKRPIFE